MKALILAIKKIITVIVAVLVPTSTATPIVSHSIATENVSTAVVAPQEETEEPQIEIVEEREAEEPAPQEEAQAEAVEEPEERYEAVQIWDVSATDEDNVTMTFYNTEDVEGLLDQLAGRITALFTPITAYAAEEDRTDNTDEDGIRTITEGNSMLTINPAADELGVEDGEEFGSGTGEDATPVDELTVEELRSMPGTVVVSGNGDMMDYVYNYFISIDAYIATVTELFHDLYNIDVVAEYPEDVEDIVELDRVAEWRVAGTENYVEITDEMRESLLPSNMLAYSPVAVVIEDGVTDISDFAFLFCSNLVRVEMSDTVTSIGAQAFSYCESLETINLSENLEVIGEDAFNYCVSLESIIIPDTCENIRPSAFDYCYNLEDVTINSHITNISNYLFYYMKANGIIRCYPETKIVIERTNLPATVTFEIIENVAE